MDSKQIVSITCSDVPTENYHATLQLPSTLPSFITGFSSLVSCHCRASLTALKSISAGLKMHKALSSILC